MKKYYCFAGLQLAVELPEDRELWNSDLLQPFEVDTAADPHRFVYRLVEILDPPEGCCIHNDGGFRVYQTGQTQVRYVGSVREDWSAAYMRVTHQGKMHTVQLKKELYTAHIGAKSVLTAMAVEHLVARAGGAVFHSSYIEVGGRAVLFTAPSGTGKSTQADLWHALRGAEIINGDRSVIRADEDGVLACGIPFAGSSTYCKNRTLPLAAIVYLAQAPETAIRKLRGAEAFRRVWEGVSVNVWDREDVSCVSETVQRVVQQVPVYHLACAPDESAVIALEKILGI